MNTIDREQIFVDQSKVLAVSLWIRIGIRVLITTALVAGVFFFLFYPSFTYLATYPIPVGVLAFVLLSGFERVVRRLFRQKSGIEGKPKRRDRFGSGVTFLGAVGKVIAALALSGVLILATIYEIPALGIAAAVILLVATVVESPQLGFFTTSTEIDKKSRLRRQTLASLSDTFPDDRFELKNASRIEPKESESEEEQPEQASTVAPPLMTGLDVENGQESFTSDPNHGAQQH